MRSSSAFPTILYSLTSLRLSASASARSWKHALTHRARSYPLEAIPSRRFTECALQLLSFCPGWSTGASLACGLQEAQEARADHHEEEETDHVRANGEALLRLRRGRHCSALSHVLVVLLSLVALRGASEALRAAAPVSSTLHCNPSCSAQDTANSAAVEACPHKRSAAASLAHTVPGRGPHRIARRHRHAAGRRKATGLSREVQYRMRP